jgi:hypothetical protein
LTFSCGLDPVASLGNRRETQVRDPVAVRLGELAHEETVLLARMTWTGREIGLQRVWVGRCSIAR